MNQRIPHHHLTQSRTRTAAGFTLMEVLIAMGIFVVGMVGIAAVFPVAISLQQAATRDVQSVQAQRNAEAMLKAVGVDPTDLHATVNDQIQPLSPSFFDQWSLTDRGYPRSLTPAVPDDPGTPLPADETKFEAEFYWVPLYRDADGNAGTLDDVSIYLFIVARQPNTVYPPHTDQANPDGGAGFAYADPPTVPKVIQTTASKKLGDVSVINIAGAGDLFRPGNQVLDNNGNIYTIREVRANEITVEGIVLDTTPALNALWHAKPAQPGGPNPAVAIIQLSNLVQP